MVEICSALGLPVTTSFVALSVANAMGVLRGRRVATRRVDQTADPVWNSRRDLAVQPQPGDLLLIEVYSTDFNRLICSGHISLDLLEESDDKVVTLPLRRQLDVRLQGKGAASLTLRRLRWLEPAFRRKTIFLVRHGQSRWNDAQKNRRLEKMVAFDHPLTRQGADESLHLQRQWEAARMAANGETVAPQPSAHAPSFDLLQLDDPPPAGGASDGAAAPPPPPGDHEVDRWLSAFLHAELIVCSPLTRAVQTAVLGLHTHPTLVSRGLTLARAAREVKGVGGLDSVSKSVGQEIMRRSRAMLMEELEDGQRVEKVMEVEVDFNDTVTEWWTGAESVDTEVDVEDRIADLFTALQLVREPPGRRAQPPCGVPPPPLSRVSAAAGAGRGGHCGGPQPAVPRGAQALRGRRVPRRAAGACAQPDGGQDPKRGLRGPGVRVGRPGSPQNHGA